MSTKSHWTANDSASTLIVPENMYRNQLVIQQRTVTNHTSLGFGDPAVDGEGVQLVAAGSVFVVAGALAREAVYAICGGGGSATGGYQEHLGICDEE